LRNYQLSIINDHQPFNMSKSSYIKHPCISVSGTIWSGWDNIISAISAEISIHQHSHIVVECYQGVLHRELEKHLIRLPHSLIISTDTIFKPDDELTVLTRTDVTDDPIFGRITQLTMKDMLDYRKVNAQRERIHKTQGIIIVYGPGASLLVPNPGLLLYVDMARWEIQLRMKQHIAPNLGFNNNIHESFSEQYKRGFFIDWRICDKLKKELYNKVDYWLDTNTSGKPRMINRQTFACCMDTAVSQPFRVVPFFDPGPWGGQWMKKKFNLNREMPNYAWCFDCVPEENSLLFEISGTIFEMPAINLVFFRSRKLLGEAVEARFGQEFPIRFDLLDTMQGGNLSLQVHPDTQYIRDHFGMSYTQDESYYMLEADTDAVVYLGLKKGIDPAAMISDLQDAQIGKTPFDVNQYVNSFSVKKHDHFLIPGGTVHCSGKNSMMLEISATPYIFTFKLWDWERLGLDGKPRPININRGREVIDWARDTDYAKAQLINRTEPIAQGNGWREERTGLHENEFIETRRHWFSVPVQHETGGGVNVLNLVEGDEAVVESPNKLFDPFVVHYAETWIVPAAVGNYTISPYGNGKRKECATIKAYVRVKA
jgi:mannose-6-phosphate isomerase class I